LGFPDLILTPWVLGREEPLHVYGPAGLQAMAEYNLAACAEDIRERLDGLLILYHQLFHGATEAELLLEVRELSRVRGFWQGSGVL
jgi:ribonuclease BN (tRNA processing enzyme)